MALLGPKCSLWLSYLSQNVHKRGKLGISGDWTSALCVFEANLINENTCVLLAVMYVRQVFFGVENPISSYYFKYPTMAAFMKISCMVITTVLMILHGHWMPKPSMIAGGAWVASLRNTYSASRAEKRKKALKKQIERLNLNFGRKTALKWQRKKNKDIAGKASIKSSGQNWVTAGKPLSWRGSEAFQYGNFTE